MLSPDGKLVLKEQYAKTTTFLESKDWMRSIGCFQSAFKTSEFDADLVSAFRHSKDYHHYLTFILTSSEKEPEFKKSKRWHFDPSEEDHGEACEGKTKG